MNWDDAYKWSDKANDEKQIEQIEPRWSWDCGLKLDFDGGLLRVSSRFYQEQEDVFSGSVSFMINDDTIFEREFSCRHIDNLKKDVEMYVNSVTNSVNKFLSENSNAFIFKGE